MSHLFQVNRVQLLCSCGTLKPITAVYFCRYCLKLHCGNCVSHEVDTLYCPNCLENMPSTEARLKKNRCANCYDCPSCGHTLSVRAASIQTSSTKDPNSSVAKKMYYLGCTSCRWSTRDVDMEDQAASTGGWNEQDNPNYKRIQNLFEYYRSIAQREKLENERKRSSKKKTPYSSLSEKYSLSTSFSSVMSRKSLSSTFAMKGDSNSSVDVDVSEAVSDVEGLPENIFSEPCNLSSVTTLAQRLCVPEWQPELTSELYPLHKHLLAKRSHRCRQCEHNLSKPEYNPSSIKFKIQLGAYYHVPELRLMNEVELKWGVKTQLQITLCNPTPHDMAVTLLPYVPETYSSSIDKKKESLEDSSTLAKRIELPKISNDVVLTAEVTLPEYQFTLTAKDDTVEYDDTDESSIVKDDPELIAWRRANKVGINVEVTPNVGCKEAIFGMILRYNYTNTVTAATDARTVLLNIPVTLNAGNILE